MCFSYSKIRIQWFLAWAAFCGLRAHHTWLTFGLGGAQGRQGPHLLREPQQPHHDVDTAHHAGTLTQGQSSWLAEPHCSESSSQKSDICRKIPGHCHGSTDES